MNHVSKSIIVTIILTLALNSTFGQKRIELEINPRSGDLFDPNIPRVGLAGGVVWVIKDAQFKSFRIVQKRDTARYIFTEPLPTVQRTTLHMKVKPYFRFKEYEWEYTIEWIDNADQPRKFDPKIAVKPIVGLTEFIFLFGFIITLITSIVFYRNWQNAVRLTNNRRQNT